MEQKINLLNTLWLYFLSDGIELVKKDGNLLNEEEKMIILPVHDKSRRTIKSELKKARRKYDKIFLATTDKAEFKSLKNQQKWETPNSFQRQLHKKVQFLHIFTKNNMQFCQNKEEL